jgi:hypothetical protein
MWNDKLQLLEKKILHKNKINKKILTNNKQVNEKHKNE